MTGVVLQQLWIVGLWALLVAAKAGRVTRALAMVTVLVSDVAIVNGFFVWLKMLPAAMLLAAAALLLTPLWSDLRKSAVAAALVGATRIVVSPGPHAAFSLRRFAVDEYPVPTEGAPGDSVTLLRIPHDNAPQPWRLRVEASQRALVCR